MLLTARHLLSLSSHDEVHPIPLQAIVLGTLAFIYVVHEGKLDLIEGQVSVDVHEYVIVLLAAPENRHLLR